MKYYLFLKRSSAAEQHATDLEKGRHAIGLCDNIAQMVLQQRKKVDTLQMLAELALKMGDRDLALQLLREKGWCQMEIARMRVSLQAALENLQAVIAFLEYESVLLGFLRMRWWIVSNGSIYTYIPQEDGEIVRMQLALRKHKSNKTHTAPPKHKLLAFRRHKLNKKPLSPREVGQQLAKQYTKNIERGMQAVTHATTLLQMVQDQQRKMDTLDEKAQLALGRGDKDLGLQLLKEKQSYEEALAMTRASFRKALETLDMIVVALEPHHTIVAPSRNNNGMTVSVLLLKSNNSENRLLIYG